MVLIGVGILIYLNRARLYVLLDKLFKTLDFSGGNIDPIEQKYQDMINKNNLNENNLKEVLKKEQDILDTLEKQQKEQVQTEKKDESGGIRQLQNKLEDKINRYSPEQSVHQNGFCYIGYDQNQRECTNVYEGDICMSGQIFPTMEVCLNPHLRP